MFAKEELKLGTIVYNNHDDWAGNGHYYIIVKIKSDGEYSITYGSSPEECKIKLKQYEAGEIKYYSQHKFDTLTNNDYVSIYVEPEEEPIKPMIISNRLDMIE